MSSVRSWMRGERGETSLTLIGMMPVILAVLMLIIAAGRIAQAQTAVESAVSAAAREVTLGTNPGAAEAAARQTVLSTLDQRGYRCPPTVSVDAAALRNAPGEPGEARVQVQCSLDLSDVLIPGMPGSVQIDREASSPVDTYRDRS